MKDIILDGNGKELKVGDRVKLEGNPKAGIPDDFGVITKITEPDADYDDNVGHGVYYPPKVYVEFDDTGEGKWEDNFHCSYDLGAWWEDSEFAAEHVCEELELVEGFRARVKASMERHKELLRKLAQT